MARMPDLVAFAQLHGLKIGTIADLIAYRRRTERFVERIMDQPFESVHGGPFRLMLYRNTIEGAEHVALVQGRIEPGKPTLVRMHQVDFAADLLGHVETAPETICPTPWRRSREHDGPGVVVFLRDPTLTGSPSGWPAADRPAAVDRSLRNYGVGRADPAGSRRARHDRDELDAARARRRWKAMACASSAGATWTEKTNP